MKVAALRALLGFALGTVSAQGQVLLTTSDGVTLNGTVRLLRSDAATCNVVAENAGNRYDELKVNQGQPLHLWELEFSVFNGSGRPLDHLAAYYSIESPWPPCRNWTNHYELQGNIAVPVQWASPSGRIQQTGRATPTRAGETHSEATLLLALHGVQPQFSDWSVNYTFADSGAPSVPPPHVTATGTELAPRAEPATPAVAAHANQTPELIAFWDGSDETNKATVDHSAWQALLDAYLAPHPSGVNRFNYAGLTAAPDDLAKLNGYLAQLEAMDPRTYARAEQKSYWINFYNALTVRVVADAYPVDSIKEVHEGWIPFTGPWGDVHAEPAGRELTLDDIQHGILRPIWQDPRIHYALNTASIGCPNLATAAYTAGNTESLLDAGAREYVNHPRGVDIVDEEFIVLSSIYEWWMLDFGGSEDGMLAHLLEYADDELAAQLQDFAGVVDYEFDWDLNRP